MVVLEGSVVWIIRGSAHTSIALPTAADAAFLAAARTALPALLDFAEAVERECEPGGHFDYLLGRLEAALAESETE